MQQVVLGYVDGFNRYMDELRAGSHPGRQAACATAAWLNDISESDVYRRFIRLSVLLSSSALEASIANAQPPVVTAAIQGSGIRAAASARPRQVDQRMPHLRNAQVGSNMYALGPEATQTGTPILLGNPHFPWFGADRLYMAQLSIPGVFDIEGAGLYGTPLITLGFNDHLAWSHTVSTAYRFTFYQLKLNPQNPTQYLFNGRYLDMQAVPLSIHVLQPNGSVTIENRTLYKTLYGPMLVLAEGGQPILGWTSSQGYTLRDANLENTRLPNQYFLWDTAESFSEFKRLHRSVLGVPWLNTAATGPDGDAYYGDISVVPNVPDAQAQACAAQGVSPIINFAFPGLPVLDGSRPECEWHSDPDAPAPGIFGPSHLPTLERTDWVANMNDSYWLTNPTQPLTGFARIIGDEGTPRSLRTRLGILQIERRLAGSDGLPGSRFSTANLENIALAAHVYSGELAQQAVLTGLCPGDGSADIQTACAALKQWDQAAALTSAGLPVWQEFWTRLQGSQANLWKVPFDAHDPVNTPNTLAVEDPSVHQALLDAQSAVQKANPAFFTAPLRSFQYSAINATRGNQPIPIFGGLADPLGIFTAAYPPTNEIGPNGYPIVVGNSYLQIVTWESGRVRATGLLTYSQSSDPANPHFADFTETYSKGQWQPLPFHENEIRAQRESVAELTGRPGH